MTSLFKPYVTGILKNSHYRIPYLGSKRTIAKELLETMLKDNPFANKFVDIFGGGGCMSFLALENGMQVIYNDINRIPVTLIKYIKNGGDFKDCNFTKFYNKSEFNKIKDKYKSGADLHPYECMVLVCYSFGNDLKSYFYSDSRAAFEEQTHNFVMFNDLNASQYLNEYFGVLGKHYLYLSKNIFPNMEWDKRRLAYTKITLKIESIFRLQELGFTCMDYFNNLTYDELMNYKNIDIVKFINKNIDISKLNIKKYNNKDREEFKDLKQIENPSYHRIIHLEKVETIQKLKRFEELSNIENQKYKLKRLEAIEELKQLTQMVQMVQMERLERLEISSLSYENFDFSNIDKDKSIIYLDPPYLNTAAYLHTIDNNHFYKWIQNLANDDFHVYLSEYTPPLCNYKVLFQKDKRVNLSVNKQIAKTKKENLFKILKSK